MIFSTENMIDLLHGWIKRPIAYLGEKLSARQFLILSSILVGLTSGIAAVGVKYLVHSIGELVSFYSGTYEDFFLFALFPVIGILLTVFYVRYFLNGKLPKGNPEIVYAIAKKSSKLPAEQTYAHMITSALTVGFGGSVGLESPMVSTGSAIGSNYGSTYRLGYKERTILLACGASAGIGAAFNRSGSVGKSCGGDCRWQIGNGSSQRPGIAFCLTGRAGFGTRCCK